MPLTPGSRFGVYDVIAAIGAGGMGEVYRARDTRLKRDVALKILPDAFGSDPERLARFQREAEVLAAVHHPNIAAIFGLEESHGARALVMELVDGDTLADRIAGGPLPVSEAVPVALQIAAALEAAHEHGIVHRDLKPANIAVTHDGIVKVLDFGLAKLNDSFEATLRSDAVLPTITSPAMTAAGVILGTAAYMSPEQAKGRAADKRCDVWAFGCVLFEMLTGRRAFDGEDVSETIAAILRAEPDWSALPRDVPGAIVALLQRCLEKNRRDRVGDLSTARFVLTDRGGLSSSVPSVAPAAPTRGAASMWRAIAFIGVPALIIGVAGAFGASSMLMKRPDVVTAIRSSIVLDAAHQITVPIDRGALAMSPDGRRLAFVAGGQLFVRELDSFEAQPLPATDPAEAPFFSPDGQWVGFFSGNRLQKISIHGGAPVTLCDSIGGPDSASWGDNGVIVFSPRGGNEGLVAVGEDGGVPEPLSTAERAADAGATARWPDALPGGDAVLFTVQPPSARTEIILQSISTGERRVLIDGGAQPTYVSSGRLVYVSGGTLMAVPFDRRAGRITGVPIAVLTGVQHAPSGAAMLAVSRSGSLAYVAGGLQEVAEPLVWVDRSGHASPIAAAPRDIGEFSLSPDGRRIAFSGTSGASDVWTYDLVDGRSTRLTFDGTSVFPIWSPNGTRVAYAAVKNGLRNVFEKSADGGGAEIQVTRCTASAGACLPDAWSPDGRQLVFHQLTPERSADEWVMPEGDFSRARPLLSSPALEEEVRISPDERWFAYISNESGRNEVYVKSFSGGPGKWQISTEGGGEPLWSRAGDELFYRNGNAVMVVPVSTNGTFRSGSPRVLFQGAFVPPAIPLGASGITSDARRFLLLEPDQETHTVGEIRLVTNWGEELKRLAGK